MEECDIQGQINIIKSNAFHTERRNYYHELSTMDSLNDCLAPYNMVSLNDFLVLSTIDTLNYCPVPSTIDTRSSRGVVANAQDSERAG